MMSRTSRTSRTSRLILPGSALVLTVLVTIGTARAGNGTHPRTPVKWEPVPACMTIVDRSVDATLTFNYTIPYEDLRPENAIDEVDNSRRHQFIGFCQWHSPQEPLAVWLSAADVETATAAGLVDAGSVAAEDILEENPAWQQCFTRVTGDDERRLITFAEASKPVVWDTAGLPAGPHVISGYTWEPPFNTWSVRPGVVKVIDDPDPAKTGPALAIMNRNEILWLNDSLTITGCIDALDGSTITGYWALTDDDTQDVLEWMTFGEDTPVSGDSFELMFTPPAPAIGESVVIKIEIVDPMDRSYTAHVLDLVDVLDVPAPGGGETGECSDGGNFISMPGCGSSGDASSGGDGSGGPGVTSMAGATDPTAPTGTTGDGGSEETGTTPETGDGGCGGCTLGVGGAPAALLAPWLLWATRRRRR